MDQTLTLNYCAQVQNYLGFSAGPSAPPAPPPSPPPPSRSDQHDDTPADTREDHADVPATPPGNMVLATAPTHIQQPEPEPVSASLHHVDMAAEDDDTDVAADLTPQMDEAVHLHLTWNLPDPAHTDSSRVSAFYADDITPSGLPRGVMSSTPSSDQVTYPQHDLHINTPRGLIVV